MHMITERQQQILDLIIASYVKDAEPIASGFIAEKLKEKVSSATIRNEFSALEEAGYIRQPHTSAGRIPTVKAYEFWVSRNLDKTKKIGFALAKRFEDLAQEKDLRIKLKNFAKLIAEISEEAVLVAFAEDDNYYTGISNLFSKPEFNDQKIIIALSTVIDHLDKVLGKLFENEIRETVILIGEQNPFWKDCSAVLSNYEFEGAKGLIVLIGPMRMDYQQNYTLINETIKLLK